MLKEVKDYYKNGNLNYHAFVDNNGLLQRINRWYFYDAKISVERICKNTFYNNIHQDFYNEDENFLFHRRNFIKTYKNDVYNGVEIEFSYE